MIRPLFVAMQKNEGQMIFLWAKYHARLVGADCITIFDNGSDCPETLRCLDLLRADGVNVIPEYSKPYHFESKGELLGDYFKYRRHEFDFFIPLDADEFIALETSAGVSFDAHALQKELGLLVGSEAPLKIKGSYYNVPYSAERFFFHPEEKVFFDAKAFDRVDMGFHYGVTKRLAPPISTNVIHIHLCHKPLGRVRRDAARKLALRVQPEQHVLDYKGPGQHLVKFFEMSHEEYVGMYSGNVLIDEFPRIAEAIGADLEFFCSDSNVDPWVSGVVIDDEKTGGAGARDRLLEIAQKVSRPPLEALVRGNLPELVARHHHPGKGAYARDVSALECIGRLFCGIAPWLESADEQSTILRSQLVDGIERDAKSQNPQLKWGAWQQSLVDASYFAIGLLNAPSIFSLLGTRARGFVYQGFLSALQQKPFDNNWILMPAIINVCLDKFWGEGDVAGAMAAVSRVDGWYVGDGFYKDGPYFALDYYNSFVFHPFLIEIARHLGGRQVAGAELVWENVLSRAQRFAEHLGRLADVDGVMPMTGRSITYRCGSLYLLAKLANEGLLPESLSEGSVRELLVAAVDESLTSPGSYDDTGFLTPGFIGSQPALAEDYITTGSLYMAALPFNMLGRSAADPFWSSGPGAWASRKVRTRLGELMVNDASLERKNGYRSTSIIRRIV